jgi:hypothetical protein
MFVIVQDEFGVYAIDAPVGIDGLKSTPAETTPPRAQDRSSGAEQNRWMKIESRTTIDECDTTR